MEKDEKLIIPGRLIRYLVFLWLAIINTGINFGLILSSFNRIPGIFIHVPLMFASGVFAIFCTIRIVNMFKEKVSEAENQLI